MYRDTGDGIFLDTGRVNKLPVKIPFGEISIHKIIVAHGAKEACERFSSDNVYGSLGISYGHHPSDDSQPFVVPLNKSNPVHILDSHNLNLILGELDTFHDFTRYLVEKERAIARFDRLTYCGEEDLLAHYLVNYNGTTKSYEIGPPENNYDSIMIGEGEWRDFITTAPYQRRKSDNAISYMWDGLLQKTARNALNGVLGGDGGIFEGNSAIYEMAKEPRMSRRALSQLIATSIRNFPDKRSGLIRHVSFFPSFFPDKGYVFLQLFLDNRKSYDKKYRPLRIRMLEIACGAAKNKFPYLKKVIGIAIDSPKHSRVNSEDFILLNCENWNKHDETYFEQANEELKFFQTDKLKEHRIRVTDFPKANLPKQMPEIGRNQLCPCGSGKKYKRCHGNR